MPFLSLPSEVHLAIFEQLSFDGHVKLNDEMPYFRHLARCVSLCKQLQPVVIACLWQAIHLRPCCFETGMKYGGRSARMVEAWKLDVTLADMVFYLSVDFHATKEVGLSILSTFLLASHHLTEVKLDTTENTIERQALMQFPLMPSLKSARLRHIGFFAQELGNFWTSFLSQSPFLQTLSFELEYYGDLFLSKTDSPDERVPICSSYILHGHPNQYLSTVLNAVMKCGWKIVGLKFPKSDPEDDMWPTEGSFEEYLEGQEHPLIYCTELLATLNSYTHSISEWEKLFDIFPGVTSLTLMLILQEGYDFQAQPFLAYFFSSTMARQLVYLELDFGNAPISVPTLASLVDLSVANTPFFEICSIHIDFQTDPWTVAKVRESDEPTSEELTRFAAATSFLAHATQCSGIAKEGQLVLSRYGARFGHRFLKLVFRDGRLWDAVKREISVTIGPKLEQWDWQKEAIRITSLQV